MHTKNMLVLTVLTAAMMIFLVPMLIEQVYAFTVGFAHCANCFFTNVKGDVSAGKFVLSPKTGATEGPQILWTTSGPLPFGGDEKGKVDADVAGVGVGHVTFFWSNPDSGRKFCGVLPDRGLDARCSITIIAGGSGVEVKYEVREVR